jgi:hypothetical protein
VWILPPSITSAYAQDTGESISVSPEQWAEACAQSLIARSKPSPPRTWLQRWKRDSWTRHLSGLISRPSRGKSFVDWWTSSLEATRASRSLPQVSEPVKTTPDTFGHGSQMELPFADLDSASSRTSKDTSRWDSPQSSATWKKWVTERRGAYSQRLKSAHLTNGSGSSSWPTSSARDWKDTPGMATKAVNPDGSERKREDMLARAVYGEANSSKWPTPAVMDTTGGPYKTEFVDGAFRSYHNHTTEDAPKYGARLRDAVTCGPPAQANPSTDGSRRESLNPRWVEALMGVPIGWTMPSCTSPVTIAPTNCDSSETESCQPQQSELF